MAIPLSNEQKQIQAPQAANIQPVDVAPLLKSMGDNAMQMNKQMQNMIKGSFETVDKINLQNDAFRRNEAERKYNETTTELNSKLSKLQGKNRVEFQPKYEALMKQASDVYEQEINKVKNFEIREGSKKHINAWNNHNAYNYQYENYKNNLNIKQDNMGQALISNQRKRVEAVNGYQAPESVVSMSLGDAFGYKSDAETIRDFYSNEMGESDAVVEERVKDFVANSALGVGIRYAQLSRKNSPAQDYLDAEKVYVGIAKAHGLDDSYTIDGRRTLQQAKIDSMAKHPVERELLMTDGQFDLGKAHSYAPDLTPEERQKVLSENSGGSRGSGGSGINKFASGTSAEEYWVNAAQVDPELWREISKDHPDNIADAINKTDWGKVKYGDLLDNSTRAERRNAVITRYKGNRAEQLSTLLDLKWLGEEMLSSGNLEGADKYAVQLIHDSIVNRLNDAINTGEFESLLGSEEKRKNLPMSTNLQLTSINRTIQSEGGEFKDWHWYNPYSWFTANTKGKVVLNRNLSEAAMRDSRAAYADTLKTFGQDADKELSRDWWTTPQSITIMSTSSSVDNISGEKKSVTSATPQNVQIIPLAYYTQDYLARQRNTVGREFVLENMDNEILKKASKPLSEWQKKELNLYKGFTGYKDEFEKWKDDLMAQSRAEAYNTMAKSGWAGIGMTPAALDAAANRIFQDKILNTPGFTQAARTQILARIKAEEVTMGEYEKTIKDGEKKESKAPSVAKMSDLGLHGNISASNSKPTVLAENSYRLMELDNILYSAGIGNFTYTSAMGGKHKEGERSHSAGHKIDFVTANGKRLPSYLEDQLEKAGFWGKGTGAVGFEVDNPKTGTGHYDVSITTPKNYQLPGQLMSRIAFADTPLHLTLNEKDTPKQTRYKNILMDYRLGVGPDGKMTREEYRRNYMGITADTDEDYAAYELRRNTDRQTQKMYNDMFEGVTEDNLSLLPHVFDISENPSLKDMVAAKYAESNLEGDAPRYIKYVSNEDIFSAAEPQEVGYGTWAGKSSKLYDQALQFPKELRRNRALFLTDSNTHYYYDGYMWNTITGNAGRIVGFMGVLDQDTDFNTKSPYSVFSKALSQLEYSQRQNAQFLPAYNVSMGDEVQDKAPEEMSGSYKNITTSDWRL